VSGPSIRLRLRVSPGASRSRVVGRLGDAWKVRIGAPPENGKANDALVGLLAETLDVPRSSIDVVSGHTSRDKTVEVRGRSEADVEARLAAFAGAPA
jgi:uncharacterized protein (TIGR00251 family)